MHFNQNISQCVDHRILSWTYYTQHNHQQKQQNVTITFKVNFKIIAQMHLNPPYLTKYWLKSRNQHNYISQVVVVDCHIVGFDVMYINSFKEM